MPFDEAAHPRAAAGAAGGGQFVAETGPGRTGQSVLGLKAKGASLPKDAKGKGGGKGKKGGKGKGKATPEQKAKAVKGIQTLLNRLGFKDADGKKLAVDGIVGPKTTAAIKRAQRRFGLPATGKLTPELLKKLKAPRMAKDHLKPKKPKAFTPVPARSDSGKPAPARRRRRTRRSLRRRSTLERMPSFRTGPRGGDQ
ncbi:peptidoglycan-binding domain-containing protein [Actinomadura montaniterrae]|uniref:Peptidoglycan-binding protein n=1 Tax=Actinomadura montaniterrae TaxID=1803903 RepID=A0A6L3VXZ2_9ACTN|nr:peptidoglycan-binding domain-containing protein [Actinomadura montaniterrae]KAB2384750.1 peptidoglycan-binding protein [Actinomadura montaniterrae]